MSQDEIARLAHEVNRVYCESIGDRSQPLWEDAPEWQKLSALAGVAFVIGNPDAPASANHESWLAVKNAAGWVYGTTKDADKKTHHCMVPFDELPKEQQVKDKLFRAVVKACE